MALMVCPECGKQVSDQAETCPHCGYPISKYIAEQKKQAEFAAKEEKQAAELEVAVASDEARGEKKPLSTKSKVIIAVCAVAILAGLAAGYVFGIKQPYDQACIAYNSIMAEYGDAVAGFNALAEEIQGQNDALDEKISALNDIVYSDAAPYDMTTQETAVNVVAKAKSEKSDLPELPAVRTADGASGYTVFQSKDILAEVETIRSETATITAATKQLVVPDYSGIMQEIAEAQTALENSILQNQQVTNPSEAFIIERLTGLPGITMIEAATEDNDPNGNLHKPGGYTAAVFFIYDQVTDSYVLNKGNTPVERGTDGGGCIEAFETVEYAKARNDYLATFDGSVFSGGSHTVCGTIVVRTSDELTATQQKELEANIIAALIELR